MTIFEKIKTKVTEKAKTIVEQARPVVEREVAKVKQKSTDDILDSILKVGAMAGMAWIAADYLKPFGIDISEGTDVARKFSQVYNEVKIENLTYNLYLGGKS